jgi:septal ring factor EnvC (AmiA/AmiB activator)
MSADAGLTTLYYFITILIVVAGAVAGVMAYVHRQTMGLVSKEEKKKTDEDIKTLNDRHHEMKERASLNEKDIKNLQEDVKDLKNQVKELDVKRRANIYLRRILNRYKETGELEEDE